MSTAEKVVSGRAGGLRRWRRRPNAENSRQLAATVATPTAILVVDHWFRRTQDTFVADRDPRPEVLARRYLDAFGDLLVLGRCVGTKPGTILAGIEHNGRSLRLLVMTNRGGPLGAFLAIPHLVRALGRSPEAVVVLNGPGMLGSLASLVALRRRPYGVEVVGDSRESLQASGVRFPLPSVGDWLTARAARRATGVSYVTAEVLQRRYPARPGAVTSHYSSIELPAAALADAPGPMDWRQPLHVVTVGSLARHDKGIDVLIDAVTLLRSRDRQVQVTVVGGGRLLGLYQDAAREAGLAAAVHFTGHVEGHELVRRILDEADIYVHPSLSEGLPRSLIEAMARGLPCIATSVGGTPELLEPELLVRPGSAEDLAEALARLIDSPERARSAACRNLEVAREYTIEVLKPRRDGFYRELANRSAESR